MKRDLILHILRNPYGWPEEKVAEARLAAADEIEKLQDAYTNMRDWAESNGVDTLAYHCAAPLPEVSNNQAEL
jgi:hypothetical protein